MEWERSLHSTVPLRSNKASCCSLSSLPPCIPPAERCPSREEAAPRSIGGSPLFLFYSARDLLHGDFMNFRDFHLIMCDYFPATFAIIDYAMLLESLLLSPETQPVLVPFCVFLSPSQAPSSIAKDAFIYFMSLREFTCHLP